MLTGTLPFTAADPMEWVHCHIARQPVPPAARLEKIPGVVSAGPARVQVTVEDTGPGLDPATAQRIFDPFFTTKPDGLGLGLSISRSIIEAHGGQLWAAPHAPHGTEFHFTISVASEAPLLREAV